MIKKYNVAVLGGGAAGCMAAIRAGQLTDKVVLVERNDTLGRKMMITGRGRCNVTNAAPIDVFIKKFAPGGEFYRTAFFNFFNDDVMEFFRSKGVKLKVERQGRVFPETDKAASIVSSLESAINENVVDIIYSKRITGIERKGENFVLLSNEDKVLESRKLVIASGGASYRDTGSSGDGFLFAEHLGHTITRLKPALVPLTTREHWVKYLQGISLENISIRFQWDKKKLDSEVGDLMFTHFGVSGPLVLDLSGEVVSALLLGKEVILFIDFKPGLRREQLESKLLHKFTIKGDIQIKNVMQDILPKRMIDIFLSLLKINPLKRASQISKDERRSIIDALKAFPLTVSGSLPIEEAMVTSGGVSTKEIDPRTMQSKIVPGVYFAGEVIDGAAPSGGYNLQQAFSTGYLAGEKAALSVSHEEKLKKNNA